MKSILFSILFFTTSISFAKPMYFAQMRSVFPDAKLSFKCNTCHDNGTRLNPFGKDFAQQVRGAGPLSDIQTWASIMKLDSDGDGVDNETEIANDTNPGKADN